LGGRPVAVVITVGIVVVVVVAPRDCAAKREKE
jgi:hypothetical protein